MEHVRPVEGLSIDTDLSVQILTTRSYLVTDEVLKRGQEVEVGGNEPMSVELCISRTLFDVYDIRHWSLLQKRGKRLLTENRRRLNTDFPHGITYVWCPRNGIQEFTPGFPCLLPSAGSLDKVVRKFIVVIDIILRPSMADIVVETRQLKWIRHND